MAQVREPGDTADRRDSASAADLDAFGALFDQHLPAVWRFARRRCGSSADADDVAAETFAVAWRRRSDAPSAEEMALWLFGVARNVLANQRRSNDRRGRLHVRLVGAAEQAPAAAPADHGLEHQTGLAEALASLDPNDRELLLLRAWDGLGVQEIGVLLDCSPNAASIRLHRARGRLAAALEAGGGVPGGAALSKEPAAPGHQRGDPHPGKGNTP